MGFLHRQGEAGSRVCVISIECVCECVSVCVCVSERDRGSLIWMNFVSEDVRVGGFYFDIYTPVKNNSKIED